MRLINAKNLEKFEHEDWNNKNNPIFEEFNNDDYVIRNAYAILSHTWVENEEVTYHDMLLGPRNAMSKLGYSKIHHTCALAQKAGISYVWIDGCCINKTDSAELSESINSMFNWYRNAQICYAFLSDVLSPDAFPRCRWLTRGWTLQELIAPKMVDFYVPNDDDRNPGWSKYGTRSSLASKISAVTGIAVGAIDEERRPIHEFSVAQRMSWAAKRRTSKTEDVAYCLLGIFGVNMPLLYGEGRKSFYRLQEEIVKRNNDMTILAWASLDSRQTEDYSLFAPSPDAFARCGRYTRANNATAHGIDVTNRGLRVTGTRRLRFAQIPDNLVRRLDSGLQSPDTPLEFLPQASHIPCQRNDKVRYVLLVAKRVQNEGSGSNSYTIAIGICLHKLTPRLFVRDMKLPLAQSSPTGQDGYVQNEDYFVALSRSNLEDGLADGEYNSTDFSNMNTSMKFTNFWPPTWWDLCNRRLFRPEYPYQIFNFSIEVNVDGYLVPLEALAYAIDLCSFKTIYCLIDPNNNPTVANALQRIRLSHNQLIRYWQELVLDAYQVSGLTNSVNVRVGQKHYRVTIFERWEEVRGSYTVLEVKAAEPQPPTYEQSLAYPQAPRPLNHGSVASQLPYGNTAPYQRPDTISQPYTMYPQQPSATTFPIQGGGMAAYGNQNNMANSRQFAPQPALANNVTSNVQTAVPNITVANFTYMPSSAPGCM